MKGLGTLIVKYKFILLTAAMSGLLLGSAYALSYLWSKPTTVIIGTSSPYIEVRETPSGPAVDSINFGNLVPGSHVHIQLYVVNTHPNTTIYVSWGSTVSNVTDKIIDNWTGLTSSLYPGEADSTEYHIMVASDCPLGTYTWTLYIV